MLYINVASRKRENLGLGDLRSARCKVDARGINVFIDESRRTCICQIANSLCANSANYAIKSNRLGLNLQPEEFQYPPGEKFSPRTSFRFEARSYEIQSSDNR